LSRGWPARASMRRCSFGCSQVRTEDVSCLRGGAFQRAAKGLQRAVKRDLDRVRPQIEDVGDLLCRQVGSESKRYQLSIARPEAGNRASQLEAGHGVTREVARRSLLGYLGDRQG